MTDEANSRRRSWRRLTWHLLRWGLAFLVLGFVVHNAASLWDAEQVDQLDVEPIWLAFAAVAYSVGWFPSVWFMRRLLSESGHAASPMSVARSYYCGHLGKYVPGKATVVLIRALLLRERGVPFGAAALATVAETLAMMGTGLALTLALATYALPDDAWDRLPASLLWLKESPGFVTLIVVVATLIVVPSVTGFAGRVAGKLAQRMMAARQSEENSGEDAVQQTDDWSLQLSAGLLIQALLAFCIAWSCHGFSLLCVLNAISDPGISLNHWLVCTVAATGGTSIGFFVLIAPGGLGIREGLIFATIAPLTGTALAGAASLLLRAVWFVTEVVVAGLLYVLPQREKNDESVNEAT